MAHPKIVVTGTGAVCASGMEPKAILDAAPRRRNRDRPDRPVGHDAAGRWRSPARSSTSTPARWSMTASCTSSSAAPTCLGLYAAGARDRGLRTSRAPCDARRRRCRRLQRPQRRLRRFGRRQLPEPVRLLPADDRGAGHAAGVRARARQHRQPDVAAAHAAQQRARPHRHPARPQGPERLRHQPQRRRRAGDHRGDGRRCATARPIAPSPSATTRRSSRRCSSTTSASACWPARRCVRSTRATTAACSAKARRRWCWKPRPRLRRAAPRCSAKSWAAASACEAEGLLGIRDDGDGVARAIELALADARHRRGRRRHDRRPRQRHAAVRLLGGRGDPARLRRSDRRR